LGIINGKEVASLISTEDETKHGQMRRGVANAFTTTSVLEMEDKFNDVSLQLMDMLQQRKEVDLAEHLLWFSLDAAAKFSFSEDIGFLRTNSDVNGTAESIRSKLFTLLFQ
jgi:hypothetical protein